MVRPHALCLHLLVLALLATPAPGTAAEPPGAGTAPADREIEQGGQLEPDDGPGAGTVAALVEELIALVRDHYVLEERVPTIEAALRRHLERGDYRRAANAVAFAWRLTADLRTASSDLHFGVQPLPPDAGPGAAAESSQAPPQPSDHGLRRTEILTGNVGYLEIGAFVDPALAAGAADEAFRTLAGTEALLIDVRASRGGHPGMVARLASYLFDGEPFVLSRIHWRNRDEPMEFWTQTDLGAPRYTGREVYVLTSAGTPSAAEGFAYHLQQLGRAVVVGETTAGAAHLTQVFPLGETFRAAIPAGRAINPRTGTNWEGRGVVPDVQVAAAEALAAAHRLALESLRTPAP